MSLPQNAVPGLVSRFLGRLRFPQLFALTAILFLVDLFVPDLIPFVDELMLGLATLLFGSWKRGRESKRKAPGPGRVVDVDPED